MSSLGITQLLGMLCVKWRGAALKPRADLGPGEGVMGALEPPPALASPVSLHPWFSCFPGSRMKSKAFALSHRDRVWGVGVDEQRWMERPWAQRLPCDCGTAWG